MPIKFYVLRVLRLTLLLTASIQITAQIAAQTAPLTPNQPVEKNISGTATHSYQINAQAGQFFRLNVEQRNIDLALTLVSANDQPLAEIDFFQAGRAESIVWIAEASGTFRLDIVSAEKNASGAYQLTLEALREPNNTDRELFAAQKAFLVAEQLAQTNKPEARKQALSEYEQSIKLWRALGQNAQVAIALSALAQNHRALNQTAPALDAYRQALDLWRTIGDPLEEAIILTNFGGIYNATNQPELAITYFQQALPIFRRIKARSDEASALNNLGVISANLGNTKDALEYHTQALALRRELKDRTGEASSLQSLGVALNQMGEKRQALKNFQDALAIRRALNNVAGITAALNSICAVYTDLGELQQALEACTQSVARQKQATSLTGLGRVYDLLGDQQEALQNYAEALKLIRAGTNPTGQFTEARTLNFMGLAHLAAGDYAQAIERFNQSLPLSRATKNLNTEAAIYNNLALAYLTVGEWKKALDVLTQAMPLMRQTGNPQSEAGALNNLGFAYEGLHENLRAFESHQQALVLARAVHDRGREAKINFGLARLERERGNLRQARKNIETSIEIVEKTRAKLTDPSRRAEYRAVTQRYYDLYIDVLMRLHKRVPKERLSAAAFEVSERARARSLLEMLTESSADLRSDAAPELVERERELQDKLNDKTTEELTALTTKTPAPQVAAIARELDQLNNELREVRNHLRASSPRYAALAQPQPLSTSEIQKQLLAPNTLLLEYALGADNSYLWALTSTSLQAYALPKRNEIEPLATRFYEALNNRDANAAELNATARTLSKMLLGPVAAQLGNKRLLIVTDGALQYVPFAALLEPIAVKERMKERETENQPTPNVSQPLRLSFSHSSTPLMAKHEVIHLPSASTLAVLREEAKGKPAATKQLAVLADPVFEKQDERVKNIEVKPAKPPAPSVPEVGEATRILLKKAAQKSGVANASFTIPRLPFTRNEADAILALAPESERQGNFDFAANRSAALDPTLGQTRILHFATHGFLNSLNPELSGLVLSLVNEQGKAQNGYLLAPELYSLKLPATELAVLSACQTGLGKDVRGEGLIGLTRGLMYAGVPRVVVSMWSVNDKATSELMKSFYQGVLVRKLRPAAALRAAQLSLWQKAQWRNPYYWAAFTLQGEWR